MRPLKFAVTGTGFWFNYQIPAWEEPEGLYKVLVEIKVFNPVWVLQSAY